MSVLIEDYIKNLTAFPITDGAITNILVKVGVDEGTDVSDLTVKQMDLCEAWTYWWCASSPLISGSVEDADSGWSHREGGSQYTVADKRLLRKMALDILKRYGLSPVKSSVQITPGGIRVFPRRKK